MTTAAQLDELTRQFDEIVEAAAGVATDDEHDPEGATIAYERSRTAALADRARQHLAEIDEALRRLQSGSYAVCERCGGPISAQRLAARPSARTCIACASITLR